MWLQQRAVVLGMPLPGAELSGTAVTNEVAQEAGHPWTTAGQPNSECFWEELAALRGAWMAPTTPGHSGHISACSTELTLPSWQIVIYAFRPC